MKNYFLTISILMIISFSRIGLAFAGTAPADLCVLDPDKLPKSWQPSTKLRPKLNPAPWSKSEAKDAIYAMETGLDEMVSYFRNKPSSIASLGADSIEALVQVTHSSANSKEFNSKVLDAARHNLTYLIDGYFESKPDLSKLHCDDFERLIPLSIFAHKLYPPKDSRTVKVTKRTNAAYNKCGSLKVATGNDHIKTLAIKQSTPKLMLELYIWALWFMEAELFPDIKLPVSAYEYAPAVWKYFKTYQFIGAKEFKDGPWSEQFIAMADIAPHIAHLPTGTHRYPMKVEYLPRLYKFHRENFYSALELGELDLFASFVDTLRQYGCTAENDVQVRDGTRFLLKIFHQGNDRWMDYRQDGETDENIDDYGLVHYPWTSILGVRVRKLDQRKPDNYGGVISRRLKLAP